MATHVASLIYKVRSDARECLKFSDSSDACDFTENSDAIVFIVKVVITETASSYIASLHPHQTMCNFSRTLILSPFV